MKIIKFIVNYIEYMIPFLGVVLTGFGLRLSTFIVPIKEKFSTDLQLEIDLAFSILLLYIIKNLISFKDYIIINTEIKGPRTPTNHITLEKIDNESIMPEFVEISIDILNAHHIKGELYLEIRYARNIEIAIDNKPNELYFKQDHEKKNIIISLNTLFNFMLKNYQRETFKLKILSNTTRAADSSIELSIKSNKIRDNLRIKDSVEGMYIKII